MNPDRPLETSIDAAPTVPGLYRVTVECADEITEAVIFEPPGSHLISAAAKAGNPTADDVAPFQAEHLARCEACSRFAAGRPRFDA